MSEWISVKDELPPWEKTRRDAMEGVHGKEYLIYPAWEGNATAFYGTRVSAEPCFYRFGVNIDSITHWMPLPEPPYEGQTRVS